MVPCPLSVCIVTPDTKLYYELDEENKISLKDIPSYHWPTKEEGKESRAVKIFENLLILTIGMLLLLLPKY